MRSSCTEKARFIFASFFHLSFCFSFLFIFFFFCFFYSPGLSGSISELARLCLFDTEALISYFCFASFTSLQIYKPCQVLFSTLTVLLDLFPLSEYLRPLRFLPTFSVSYKRYKMSASVSVIRIYDVSNSYLSRKSQHISAPSVTAAHVVWITAGRPGVLLTQTGRTQNFDLT